MINIGRMFARFLKKHQKTTAFLFTLLLFFFSEVVYENIKENIALIKYNHTKVERNDQRLISVENQLRLNSDVVTRNSFNNYIARSDNEYHRQQYFNEQVIKSIGVLSGKVFLLEKFIKPESENKDKDKDDN